MDLFDKCHRYTHARAVQAAGYYPYFHPLQASDGCEVQVGGRRLVMAGSNNYLGLTHHPEVLRAARDAVARYGTSCTGSRFLNGTLELHVELERRLARFVGKEAALCFSTGYQTNLGVIGGLCSKDDVIFTDRDNHASIFDGCRQSFAEVRKFRHGDCNHLEELLRAEQQHDQDSGSARGRLILVDGVFSMMGDLPDLERICALAEEFGARVMVDEAHSLGVLGDNGRGAAEHFGVGDRVDLIGGTFSKSLASIGGFVAGPEPVIHYLKHHARSLIFSASIPPSAAAAALAALDVLEREPGLRVRLHENARRVRSGLAAMGFRIGGPTDGTGPAVPVVPVVVGEQLAMFRFWKALFEGGVFTNPVTQPAVPPGFDLIRTSYMASHTDAQIARVLEVFETVGTRHGLIGRDTQEAALA